MPAVELIVQGRAGPGDGASLRGSCARGRVAGDPGDRGDVGELTAELRELGSRIDRIERAVGGDG
jgi:hypothetical protein